MSTAEMGGGRLSGPDGAAWSAPEGAPYRWRWLAFAVVLTFALAFLLPRRARPEWTPDTHALAETGVGPFGPEPGVREAQA
jgi:hypothetical protein